MIPGFGLMSMLFNLCFLALNGCLRIKYDGVDYHFRMLWWADVATGFRLRESYDKPVLEVFSPGCTAFGLCVSLGASKQTMAEINRDTRGIFSSVHYLSHAHNKSRTPAQSLAGPN
jgi:hypothetical protein